MAHFTPSPFSISLFPVLGILQKIIVLKFSLQVAAKVIGEVQALIIFPTLPYIILVIFLMFWASAALHLFSSGQVLRNECNANCCSYDLKANRVNCDNCCGYSIHYTPHITVAILFHLFGCFWVTQFIIASSSTVIAGSVASYYWTRGEVSVSKVDLCHYPKNLKSTLKIGKEIENLPYCNEVDKRLSYTEEGRKGHLLVIMLSFSLV